MLEFRLATLDAEVYSRFDQQVAVATDDEPLLHGELHIGAPVHRRLKLLPIMPRTRLAGNLLDDLVDMLTTLEEHTDMLVLDLDRVPPDLARLTDGRQ